MSAIKTVCHVSTNRTAKGSRVAAQLASRTGSNVIVVRPHTIFSSELFYFSRSQREATFVFHQQPLLPLLLVTHIFLFVTRRYQKVVYDMHDLAEMNKYMSEKGRLLVRIYQHLEKITAYFGIETLTVSKGLAEVYAARVGRMPRVYYNNNLNCSRLSKVEHRFESKRIVYFGQIKEERLGIADLELLIGLGYSIDLYGTFSKKSDSFWSEKVLESIKKSGGHYFGVYNSQNMSFLSAYDYSLMVFRSDRENIKFCMPNKLFQSLEAGLICIASASMSEVFCEFFSLGCVWNIEDMPDEKETLPVYNWSAIERKLRAMRRYSNQKMCDIVD